MEVKAKRNTRQKQIVRSVFEGMRNHPTADMVCAEVAKVDPTIGRATVYRLLSSYVEEGSAIRVPVHDGADRFDITVLPHDHAKCLYCGKVLDVTVEGELPRVKDDGFLVQGGAVLYYGVCRECSQNT